MSLLDRKAIRELGLMKGQFLAIALLIALAVGTFVGAASTHRSLENSRDSYYSNQRFGDVFASVVRAPKEAADRLRAIAGVAVVQERIAASGLLSLPNFDEPAAARLVGLPASGVPDLGRLHLRIGRLPESLPVGEVVVSEAMANAHGLVPGDRLRVTVDGRQVVLTIVGIGLSPEHVYEVRPGEMFPDNLRFGVLWVQQSLLEEALGMRGGFNEVVLELEKGSGVAEEEVIAQVDQVLSPYGGLGAHGRDLHVSARFISDELKQLEATAYFAPALFMAVAVFLLNMIVGRVIATQREQIATLKALGFSNASIGLHYVKLTVLVVALGSLAGIGIGYWFGSVMMEMYADYYRFAHFDFGIGASDALVSVGAALVASVAGTLGAVRGAVKLKPAEAMRPAAPAVYRRSFFEHLGVHRLLSTTGRMVLRNLSRRPGRAAASCVGLSFAVALLILGLFFSDAMDVIIDGQFRRAQRQDLTVAFNRPVAAQAIHELEAMQGVWKAEPRRELNVTLHHGHRSHRTVLMGMPSGGAALQRVLSEQGGVLEIPAHGLMLSDVLANNIGARVGDPLWVELLEGRRNTVRAVVAAIVDEPFGTSAYASLETVHGMAGTGPQITSALLHIDERHELDIYRNLGSMPTVMAVSSRTAMLAAFDKMIEEVLLLFTGALTVFAGAMAVGVTYNAARISLSERERELATMRVIGMTRGEVAGVLFGEMFTLVALAMPLGCFFGHEFAKATADSVATEMYRIPLVISPSTYVYAMAVVVLSSLLVAGVVRRRLNKLDLVSVLKTKE